MQSLIAEAEDEFEEKGISIRKHAKSIALCTKRKEGNKIVGLLED